uniref:Ribonuclease H-like domain-containing protein n=1 Tax=Tanacetum cinerariifolium TaxID=118510 RepID=A0A6L2N2B4_TANCI|nr:ribonuclease H-like domain-containing protein [Tanacetum cinerariifolium]
MSYLYDFKEFDGGYVTFGGGANDDRIASKETLKTGKFDFEDVYFVKELKFNLLSVSQMCDKKNSVLFTDTECFVLSPDFKLIDESQVLLKVPRRNNMYIVDMKNIVPKESLTCLVANATLDKSMLWQRRLGHINFKNINKLVKDKLVRGLPSKHFENDQTCVACLKGKQHKAFSTKNEAVGILKKFIIEIENLVDKEVNVIRCDNGTVFKNSVMNDFCAMKGINDFYAMKGTNSDDFAGTKDSIGAGQSNMETESTQGYIFMSLCKDGSPPFDSSLKISSDAEKKHDEVLDKECGSSNELNYAFENLNTEYPDDPKIPGLKTIETYDDSEEEADFTNLESSIHVNPTPTTRTHKNHPLKQVFRNKKDKRGIVIKNKARLVAQGHTQEEGIDYDEFFAHVARIEAIRLFLAYASFMGFMVYQMDVNSAFLYGRIEKEELCIEFERLMKDKFQMSSMGELTFFLGLQGKQKEDGIFISQDKYAIEVLRKFNFSDVKSVNTLVDTEKTLVKDADGADVDVHLYRSMIRSLMYLTTSRPDSLWYPRDSPFELVAYTDSDYVGASLDKKSTTEGCQFLGSRLIS